MAAPADDSVRINKALAQAGFGSRRTVEQWIRAGRLQVNGEPAELGQKVVPQDTILLDGKALELPVVAGETQVILYNKPIGQVTTRRDPEGRPTVFDKLPAPTAGRWVSVGRLDINTAGLLLFTTDGELANYLMHPSSEIEREYSVRVLGEVDGSHLEQLLKGVQLEDGMARFSSVTPGGGTGANRWYKVVLKEGRQREVRRLWEALGLKVSRLIRTRYGSVRLPRELNPGSWQELGAQQIRELRGEEREGGRNSRFLRRR